MKYALWILVPIGLFGQTAPSPGSLYVASGRLADAVRDLRASQIDDLLTIVVSENVSAIASGVTNSTRKSSAANNIASLAGPVAAKGPLGSLLGITNNQQLQGQGQTSRTSTVATTLSARVVGVTYNGLLMIEATKEIVVNSEKQSIAVHGLVRPSDVTPANTISSRQVADLELQINGKGVVGDAIKRPFILYRVLLGLLPF
jgi:flagellar L-ring protein precursor FlgH